ncbi:MAG: hypothetical protein HYS06_11295 [Methylocystis sp.]|nr:hypothetical protein [Methylocystis sp.]MBI3276101.1 hypothetical protein [Methylocystis sp.]
MGRIFVDWREANAQVFGRRALTMRHCLDKSPLFDEDALARLIEASPRERFHVNALPCDAADARPWREGDIAGLSGAAVLEAVRKGALRVHLQRVQDTFPAYRQILEVAFDELEQRVPGLRSYKRSMSVEISSPQMSAAYHADIPCQSLWQARGRKRVWIYPARPPFLPQAAIENIVLKRSLETDLGYDPAFDKEAEVFDLGPGDMATWPLNCPHRVVNEDCLNISFTTEHWTNEQRAHYAVNYANGLLRPLFGGGDLPQLIRGPAFVAKFVLAGAHEALCGANGRARPSAPDFRVDPTAAQGFADVAPYQIMG